MLHRTLISVTALALAACAAQKSRPPPEEPASTTSVTSAALTTSTSSTAVEATAPAPKETPPETLAPLAPRFREALARNPALAGIPVEHLQIEQVGGHVTLRGRLPTVADAVQVEMTIRQMRGVTTVTNDIQAFRR